MAAHSEHTPLGAREEMGGDRRTARRESRELQVDVEPGRYLETQGRQRVKEEVKKVEKCLVMTTGSKCLHQVYKYV